MAHAAQHHSSGFGSFLLGVIATLAVLAAAAFWLGTRAPVFHTASLERPTISIPMPRLPPPPGVIPKAQHTLQAR